MKISSAVGEFKILQTVKNRDELLVLGSWNDLVRLFDSSRTFLVNRAENLFGLYLCKQECADFLTKILQQIDNQDSEDFRIEKNLTEKRYLA